MNCTPKQRMLNAYRGVACGRSPVAPEFWYYYPAKVLGVDMIEFEREVPHWQALQTTFKKYDCEGWGCVGVSEHVSGIADESSFDPISDGQYRRSTRHTVAGKTFTSSRRYDTKEPSWSEEYPVKHAADLPLWVAALLDGELDVDFGSANAAHRGVGEDYLLELALCSTFFDFFGGLMGFEKALLYFMDERKSVLQAIRERYVARYVELARKACAESPFESFLIGCGYSCNSLIGPDMWREWDKPVIRAIGDELHRHGRLLHIHFHGACMATVSDFAESGIDCVCPFERPPGGDVDGADGLRRVRELLGGKTAMNGNVHTVETLINGGTEDVRREVRQIKQAFAGEARLVIGTGDQVGGETPEENILAMIDEAKQ